MVNGSNKAQDWKYNGIELEEALGVNLYEMDLRQYDPALARWTAIDPVTHHSQSTYNGFDNNPVYWADPSGADSVREAKANKPEWDNRITSNDGDGTKPKIYTGSGVVGEDSGMVNQLPTVCVGCNDGSGYWSSEGEMYGTALDFEAYKKHYGYSGSFDEVNNQWSKEHGESWANQVTKWESQRKADATMAHLKVWHTFFYQAEEVFYVMPGTAFGSLARGSTRVFGFKGILPKGGKPVFEIGEGVRRAKAAQELGYKYIHASDNAGNIFNVPLKNLRPPFKNTIDISTPINRLRYNRIYNGFKDGDKLPPIYVNPGTRGIKINDIKFKQ